MPPKSLVITMRLAVGVQYESNQTDQQPRFAAAYAKANGQC